MARLRLGVVWEGPVEDLAKIEKSLLDHDRIILSAATSDRALNLVKDGVLLVHAPRDKRGEIRR